MFYNQVKLVTVLGLAVGGVLTLDQWVIIGCLLFGCALATALHFQWLKENTHWIAAGGIVMGIFALALIGGHDVLIKKVIAILLMPVFGTVVRYAQTPPRVPQTAPLVEAHRKKNEQPTTTITD